MRLLTIQLLMLLALSSAVDAQTFIAGQITLPSDLEVVDTKSFTCTPARPLKKGDTLATRASEAESWSVASQSSKIGDKQMTYPFMGLVKGSDGGRRAFFAATLSFKIDMKAGEVVHSEGYKIEAKRAVKAGEPIPAIYFFSPIFSVEPAQGAKGDAGEHPAVVISSDSATPGVLKPAEEVWQAFEKHVSR